MGIRMKIGSSVTMLGAVTVVTMSFRYDSCFSGCFRDTDSSFPRLFLPTREGQAIVGTMLGGSGRRATPGWSVTMTRSALYTRRMFWNCLVVVTGILPTCWCTGQESCRRRGGRMQLVMRLLLLQLKTWKLARVIIYVIIVMKEENKDDSLVFSTCS